MTSNQIKPDIKFFKLLFCKQQRSIASETFILFFIVFVTRRGFSIQRQPTPITIPCVKHPQQVKSFKDLPLDKG